MQKLGKICLHHQKERLNINTKLPNLKAICWKLVLTVKSLASEDTAP